MSPSLKIQARGGRLLTPPHPPHHAQAPAGAGPRPAGPFRQAIVFMVGGGNYLEAESLQCWASRAQPAPKHVVYGATELLAPEQVLDQLSELAALGGL